MQEIALIERPLPAVARMIDSTTLWHEVVQPTVTLRVPGGRDGVHIAGLPAVLVIVALFAIVLGFIARFVFVRRSARAAVKQLRTTEAEQRSLFAHPAARPPRRPRGLRRVPARAAPS